VGEAIDLTDAAGRRPPSAPADRHAWPTLQRCANAANCPLLAMQRPLAGRLCLHRGFACCRKKNALKDSQHTISTKNEMCL
jgi:hypothetical protein